MLGKSLLMAALAGMNDHLLRGLPAPYCHQQCIERQFPIEAWIASTSQSLLINISLQPQV
jgi:hypothetical protein